METFSALLALCAGNSPVTGEFPTQRPVTRSFDVVLICTWINDGVNNREAGDLRRHRVHYDVTVLISWADGDFFQPYLEFCWCVFFSLMSVFYFPLSCSLWMIISFLSWSWINSTEHETWWSEIHECTRCFQWVFDGTGFTILWHDDVTKWKHFPRYWPFMRGIHRSRWIPRTKASDAELWCFLWSAPE